MRVKLEQCKILDIYSKGNIFKIWIE